MKYIYLLSIYGVITSLLAESFYMFYKYRTINIIGHKWHLARQNVKEMKWHLTSVAIPTNVFSGRRKLNSYRSEKWPIPFVKRKRNLSYDWSKYERKFYAIWRCTLKRNARLTPSVPLQAGIKLHKLYCTHTYACICIYFLPSIYTYTLRLPVYHMYLSMCTYIWYPGSLSIRIALSRNSYHGNTGDRKSVV